MKKYTLQPEYHRVLVKPYQIMRESTGTIKLAMMGEDEAAVLQAGHPFGEIVAMGDTAFTKDRWGEDCDRKYEVGDAVYFKKYPGPDHCSETDDFGRPQGDTFYTVNDVDILGHVTIEEIE